MPLIEYVPSNVFTGEAREGEREGGERKRKKGEGRRGREREKGRCMNSLVVVTSYKKTRILKWSGGLIFY